MKGLIWRLCLVASFAGLVLSFRTTSAFAAEERDGELARLERLERRVNEIAERQEQFMHQLGAQMERQARMGQPGNENLRPPWKPGPPGMPVPPPNVRLPDASKGLPHFVRLLFLIAIICNILLAIWIFTDIRKRGEGSGIFIAVALVAGIPAALIYALTRLGDKKT